MSALQQLTANGFEIRLESHAEAILEHDFPEALDQLVLVLLAVRIPIGEIIGSGGGEAKGTQRMRRAFNQAGWRKGKFEIRKTINDVERESISHEVDHIQYFGGKCLALEIEWNNKDLFFDRDLDGEEQRMIDYAVIFEGEESKILSYLESAMKVLSKNGYKRR